MMTRKRTPIQTPLFVIGLAFGLISSLTGCDGGSTCGKSDSWFWESDGEVEEVEPNVAELPAVYSQSADDALQLDDLEMEVVSEDQVVLTYFVTDADGEDRLIEVQLEVTDIYQVFY